ncbi:hypothetical protein THII_3188 [Thioploca ingrica]|uniref:Lysozyme inhibitor LprI-like N-terminal domain-containing protein n=1 Tax=Thioploca ingrica TaxID=40754 RepID=A0A090APN8_9GAMM|nr:hypothetical protein THII_3188 [Thioploca ingrica]
MKIIVKLMLLFALHSVYVSAQLESELPVTGRWKIISYRISSSADKTQAKNWVDKLIEFTPQTALLYDGDTYPVCPLFEYQVTTENAQQFFLSHYQIEPNQLGVIQTEVQVVTIVCKAPNWPADKSIFIKVADEQMLSQWNGIIFYFSKQKDPTDPTPLVQTTNSDTLLVTPQSVGLINPESDFTQATLMENFPDYTITEETQTHETSQSTVAHFKLSRENKLLLKVYPNLDTHKIKSISLFDPRVQVPGKAKLGMTYTQLFKDQEAFIDCQAGTTPARRKQTVCFFKNIPTIQYVFEYQGSSNNGLLSPIEILNRAKLVEWVWIASQPLVPSPAEKKRVEVEPANTSSETDAAGPIDAKTALAIQNQRLQELSHQFSEVVKKQFPISPAKEQDPSNPADQPQSLTYFTQSQQTWEQYRNDNCQWYSSLEPDETQQALKNSTCLEQMARDRTDEIEQLLKQLPTR